jgi:hypothetical protein
VFRGDYYRCFLFFAFLVLCILIFLSLFWGDLKITRLILEKHAIFEACHPKNVTRTIIYFWFFTSKFNDFG